MKKFSLLLAVVLLLSPVLFSCNNGEEGAFIPGEKIENPVVVSGEADKMFHHNEDGRIIVVLDAGHGFKDTGCPTEKSVRYTWEREITIDLVQKLKTILEEKGITVFLSHDGEVFPDDAYMLGEANRLGIDYNPDNFEENDNYTKYERALYTEILNKAVGIDLFISLHVNTVEAKPETVSGTTIDYYAENEAAEELNSFSESFKEKLDEKNLTDSFVIFADDWDDAYAVTKYTTAPAVLIETAYATNSSDIKKLDSDEWQNDFLDALADTVFENFE